MNPHRRSPFVLISTALVYFFLYAPIIVLIVFAFNSSRTNVLFGGFITEYGPLEMDGSTVVQSPCGPFHWFCELSKNSEVTNATKNTLTIATISTLTSTIIGTLAALALQRYNFRLKAFSQVSLYIPIVIPEIVMGIGILVLFSQLFSLLNSSLGLAGDTRCFVRLLRADPARHHRCNAHAEPDGDRVKDRDQGLGYANRRDGVRTQSRHKCDVDDCEYRFHGHLEHHRNSEQAERTSQGAARVVDIVVAERFPQERKRRRYL